MSDEFTPGFSLPPQIEDPAPEFEVVNPWTAILVKPRAALRFVLETDPRKGFWSIPAFLILISAPQMGLSFYASFQEMGSSITDEATPFIGIFALGFLLIGIPLAYAFYLILIYFYGWFYKVLGSMFSGVGTYQDLRAAYIWSMFPSAVITLVLMPLTIYGSLQHGTQLYGLTDPISWVTIFLQISLYAYWLVLHCKCIGEAHQFSAWHGFGVFVISMVIIFSVFIVFFILLFIAFVVLGMAMSAA
jgi:hypothetical protein